MRDREEVRVRPAAEELLWAAPLRVVFVLSREEPDRLSVFRPDALVVLRLSEARPSSALRLSAVRPSSVRRLPEARPASDLPVPDLREEPPDDDVLLSAPASLRVPFLPELREDAALLVPEFLAESRLPESPL